MASNALDNGQANTLIFSTTRSNPTVPTLGRLDYSIIGNTDALTTEFALEDCIGINWARLLGYYIPYLITGKCYGPIWQYGHDIEHSYSTNVVKPRTYT